MTAYVWAVCAACACLCLWRAYEAGRRAERLKKLREEVRSYEQMESVRRRVDGLSADGLLSVLRAGAHKK
ncbi:MAG: hypothetical protein PUK24_04115 [Elusimicrobia bacterium]|nr:hypothetical protein [Elusimicrobiota bacterium]MDY6039036.1 hypothetical protein [Elusimicrobiaceae bacterium]